MKFISFKNKHENIAREYNSIIAIGKLFNHNNIQNGYYLTFIYGIPKVKTFINGDNFESYLTPCKKFKHFMFRKVGTDTMKSLMCIKGIIPTSHLIYKIKK